MCPFAKFFLSLLFWYDTHVIYHSVPFTHNTVFSRLSEFISYIYKKWKIILFFSKIKLWCEAIFLPGIKIFFLNMVYSQWLLLIMMDNSRNCCKIGVHYQPLLVRFSSGLGFMAKISSWKWWWPRAAVHPGYFVVQLAAMKIRRKICFDYSSIYQVFLSCFNFRLRGSFFYIAVVQVRVSLSGS